MHVSAFMDTKRNETCHGIMTTNAVAFGPSSTHVPSVVTSIPSSHLRNSPITQMPSMPSQSMETQQAADYSKLLRKQNATKASVIVHIHPSALHRPPGRSPSLRCSSVIERRQRQAHVQRCAAQATQHSQHGDSLIQSEKDDHDWSDLKSVKVSSFSASCGSNVCGCSSSDYEQCGGILSTHSYHQTCIAYDPEDLLLPHQFASRSQGNIRSPDQLGNFLADQLSQTRHSLQSETPVQGNHSLSNHDCVQVPETCLSTDRSCTGENKANGQATQHLHVLENGSVDMAELDLLSCRKAVAEEHRVQEQVDKLLNCFRHIAAYWKSSNSVPLASKNTVLVDETVKQSSAATAPQPPSMDEARTRMCDGPETEDDQSAPYCAIKCEDTITVSTQKGSHNSMSLSVSQISDASFHSAYPYSSLALNKDTCLQCKRASLECQCQHATQLGEKKICESDMKEFWGSPYQLEADDGTLATVCSAGLDASVCFAPAVSRKQTGYSNKHSDFVKQVPPLILKKKSDSSRNRFRAGKWVTVGGSLKKSVSTKHLKKCELLQKTKKRGNSCARNSCSKNQIHNLEQPLKQQYGKGKKHRTAVRFGVTKNSDRENLAFGSVTSGLVTRVCQNSRSSTNQAFEADTSIPKRELVGDALSVVSSHDTDDLPRSISVVNEPNISQENTEVSDSNDTVEQIDKILSKSISPERQTNSHLLQQKKLCDDAEVPASRVPSQDFKSGKSESAEIGTASATHSSSSGIMATCRKTKQRYRKQPHRRKTKLPPPSQTVHFSKKKQHRKFDKRVSETVGLARTRFEKQKQDGRTTNSLTKSEIKSEAAAVGRVASLWSCQLKPCSVVLTDLKLSKYSAGLTSDPQISAISGVRGKNCLKTDEAFCHSSKEDTNTVSQEVFSCPPTASSLSSCVCSQVECGQSQGEAKSEKSFSSESESGIESQLHSCPQEVNEEKKCLGALSCEQVSDQKLSKTALTVPKVSESTKENWSVGTLSGCKVTERRCHELEGKASTSFKSAQKKMKPNLKPPKKGTSQQISHSWHDIQKEMNILSASSCSSRAGYQPAKTSLPRIPRKGKVEKYPCSTSEQTSTLVLNKSAATYSHAPCGTSSFVGSNRLVSSKPFDNDRMKHVTNRYVLHAPGYALPHSFKVLDSTQSGSSNMDNQQITATNSGYQSVDSAVGSRSLVCVHPSSSVGQHSSHTFSLDPRKVSTGDLLRDPRKRMMMEKKHYCGISSLPAAVLARSHANKSCTLDQRALKESTLEKNIPRSTQSSTGSGYEKHSFTSLTTPVSNKCSDPKIVSTQCSHPAKCSAGGGVISLPSGRNETDTTYVPAQGHKYSPNLTHEKVSVAPSHGVADCVEQIIVAVNGTDDESLSKSDGLCGKLPASCSIHPVMNASHHPDETGKTITSMVPTEDVQMLGSEVRKTQTCQETDTDGLGTCHQAMVSQNFCRGIFSKSNDTLVGQDCGAERPTRAAELVQNEIVQGAAGLAENIDSKLIQNLVSENTSDTEASVLTEIGKSVSTCVQRSTTTIKGQTPVEFKLTEYPGTEANRVLTGLHRAAGDQSVHAGNIELEDAHLQDMTSEACKQTPLTVYANLQLSTVDHSQTKTFTEKCEPSQTTSQHASQPLPCSSEGTGLPDTNLTVQQYGSSAQPGNSAPDFRMNTSCRSDCEDTGALSPVLANDFTVVSETVDSSCWEADADTDAATDISLSASFMVVDECGDSEACISNFEEEIPVRSSSHKDGDSLPAASCPVAIDSTSSARKSSSSSAASPDSHQSLSLSGVLLKFASDVVKNIDENRKLEKEQKKRGSVSQNIGMLNSRQESRSPNLQQGSKQAASSSRRSRSPSMRQKKRSRSPSEKRRALSGISQKGSRSPTKRTPRSLSSSRTVESSSPHAQKSRPRKRAESPFTSYDTSSRSWCGWKRNRRRSSHSAFAASPSAKRDNGSERDKKMVIIL